MTRRWSADEDATLTEMWLADKTIPAISRELEDRTERAVAMRRVALNLAPRTKETIARRVWSSREEAAQFIDEIRNAQLRRGISSSALARETGLSPPLLSRLFSGDGVPGAQAKKKLQKWLDA